MRKNNKSIKIMIVNMDDCQIGDRLLCQTESRLSDWKEHMCVNGFTIHSLNMEDDTVWQQKLVK